MNNNEKFQSYFLDSLKTQFSEAVFSNLSLQVNAKISNEIIESIAKENAKLVEQVELLTRKIQENNDIKDEAVKTGEQKITSARSQATIAEEKLVLVEQQRDTAIKESTAAKAELQHLQTYKNELLKSRDEVAVLTRKVLDMQTHIDIVSQKPTLNKKSTKKEPEVIRKDGGEF